MGDDRSWLLGPVRTHTESRMMKKIDDRHFGRSSYHDDTQWWRNHFNGRGPVIAVYSSNVTLILDGTFHYGA